mmetsp:Transcript_1196/g.3310  ORF Transcript_1196/g.3310 Transcript_1196/m.3310 type:complete len:296 (-) Transcript_1196:351-1238(-)
MSPCEPSPCRTASPHAAAARKRALSPISRLLREATAVQPDSRVCSFSLFPARGAGGPRGGRNPESARAALMSSGILWPVYWCGASTVFDDDVRLRGPAQRKLKEIGTSAPHPRTLSVSMSYPAIERANVSSLTAPLQFSHRAFASWIAFVMWARACSTGSLARYSSPVSPQSVCSSSSSAPTRREHESVYACRNPWMRSSQTASLASPTYGRSGASSAASCGRDAGSAAAVIAVASTASVLLISSVRMQFDSVICSGETTHIPVEAKASAPRSAFSAPRASAIRFASKAEHVDGT